MQVIGRKIELPVDSLVVSESTQVAEQLTAREPASEEQRASALQSPLEIDHNPLLRDRFWELEELKITQAKQKDDCLYLHCQSDQPSKILQAIAPNSHALSSSVMFAEGVRRVKLHGQGWAFGVDLPVDRAALLAAEIIECLRRDPKTKKTALKVLLHQNCLNILCESKLAMAQAVMALPILSALRQTRPSDYLQSVTVSSRVIGQKLPSWSFEIDLLAIGIVAPSDRPDPLSESSDEAIDISEFADTEEETRSVFVTQGLSVLKYVLTGKWLFATQPKPLSAIACVSSLVIGVMATFVLDRTLFHYAQSNAQLKTQAQSTSVELKGNRMTDRPKLNFQIDLLNDKLALIDWYISGQRRPPDVLIMGSSRALRGVEPTILEQSLAQNGYKGVSAFNFGVNGATAKVVNLQLAEILSSQQLPKMIIWADGVRAFNSNRTDITYDEISTSPGYKQLLASRKSSNTSGESKADSNVDVNSNKNLDVDKPVTPLGKIFHAIFDSYPQRQQVRGSLVKGFEQSTLLFSNRRELLRSAQPNRSTEMDSKGFVGFDVDFDPKTYFQTHPQVSGDYDLDYRDFNLNGKQMESFAAVSEFCRQHNIQLVFVNLPLHNVYLDSARSRYEYIFSTKMRELSSRLNFTYIDLSQTWRNEAALFSDPSHLNRKGAIVVAKELASHPQIRWKYAGY